ncbi:MAG: WD40 repeat domain-containing protein [Bacteroidota bacterium]
MASPESAQSEWVAKEVNHWLENRPGLTSLHLVVTGGHIRWDETIGDFDPEYTDCLPPDLFGKFSEEPLFTDLRTLHKKGEISFDNPDFVELLKPVLSALHEKSIDELFSEERERLKKRLLVAYSIGALLFGLFVVATTLFFQSEQRRKAALRNELLVNAELYAESNTKLALEYARKADSVASNLRTRSLLNRYFYRGGEYTYSRLFDDYVYGLVAARDVEEILVETTDGRYVWDFSADTVRFFSYDEQPSPSHWKFTRRNYSTLSDTELDSLFSEQVVNGLKTIYDGQVLSLALDTVNGLYAVAFNKDRDYRINILNEDLELQDSYQGHLGPVECMTFSGDGKYLLSGGEDQRIVVWKVEAEGELYVVDELIGHTGPVTDLALTHDEKYLISAARDGAVRLWEWKNFKLRDFGIDSPPVTEIVVSERADWLVLVDASGANFYGPRADSFAFRIEGDYSEGRISFSAKEDILIAVDTSGIMGLYNSFGEKLAEYETEQGTIAGFVSPDGENFMTVHEDRLLVRNADFSIIGSVELSGVPGDNLGDNIARWSADGRHCLINNSDAPILWSIENNQFSELRPYDEHLAAGGAKLVDDFGAIFVGYDDGYLRQFNLDGELVDSTYAPGCWEVFPQLTTDGGTLFLTVNSGDVFAYSIAGKSLTRISPTNKAHQEKISLLKFNSTSDLYLVNTINDRLLLYDTMGNLIYDKHEFSAYSSRSADFFNGNLLFVDHASRVKSVRLFDDYRQSKNWRD